MGKIETATEPSPVVTVRYNLFDLPTAQHKAGLAGLLLEIASLENREPDRPRPRVLEQTTTSATIEFTEKSVQMLFDDLYAAAKQPVKVKSKWQGATLLGEEEKDEMVDGKTKKIKLFVYEVVQPTCPFLRQHVKHEVWLKLWRDMLWTIPRGIPLTRLPFEQRANGQPCKEGSATWDDLLKVEKARTKNTFHTTVVAGSLWLGAQATNAESIRFEGRAEHNLLLHFWPLTVLVYAPQLLQPDGESEFVGYVLAIPEVADLTQFMTDYQILLAGLQPDIRGYRPAEAVIDLPAEGALSFLEHLARLASSKTQSSEISYSIGSIEFMHLVKIGNNTKLMTAGRIAPRPYLTEEYQAIVGKPGEKPPFGNPLFRRGLMLSLLEEKPWFQPFGKMLVDWPAKFFVPSEDSPRNLLWFWADARKKIQEVIQAMPTEPDPANPPDVDDALAATINRFVQHYLDEFFKRDNPEWDFKAFRKAKMTPQDASEARRKLAERLFLEFRSRHHQAFTSHFSGTFFRVPQWMGRDFEMIAKKLFDETDTVKTLTLMALSANSWIPSPKKETDQ